MKLYTAITIGEIDTLADTWLDLPEERLSRMVDRELTEWGYGWDVGVSDHENRAEFHALCERVLASIQAKQRLRLR